MLEAQARGGGGSSPGSKLWNAGTCDAIGARRNGAIGSTVTNGGITARQAGHAASMQFMGADCPLSRCWWCMLIVIRVAVTGSAGHAAAPDVQPSIESSPRRARKANSLCRAPLIQFFYVSDAHFASLRRYSPVRSDLPDPSRVRQFDLAQPFPQLEFRPS